MRLHRLKVGDRFRREGRRAVLTVLGKSRMSHPYTVDCHIQHHKGKNAWKGPRFIPRIEVRNSSGRKFDVNAWLNVIPMP